MPLLKTLSLLQKRLHRKQNQHLRSQHLSVHFITWNTKLMEQGPLCGWWNYCNAKFCFKTDVAVTMGTQEVLVWTGASWLGLMAYSVRDFFTSLFFWSCCSFFLNSRVLSLLILSMCELKLSLERSCALWHEHWKFVRKIPVWFEWSHLTQM